MLTLNHTDKGDVKRKTQPEERGVLRCCLDPC